MSWVGFLRPMMTGPKSPVIPPGTILHLPDHVAAELRAKYPEYTMNLSPTKISLSVSEAYGPVDEHPASTVRFVRCKSCGPNYSSGSITSCPECHGARKILQPHG